MTATIGQRLERIEAWLGFSDTSPPFTALAAVVVAENPASVAPSAPASTTETP